MSENATTATGARTNNHDIELETTLEELVLDLAGNRVETNVGRGPNLLNGGGGHGRIVGGKRKRGQSLVSVPAPS